MKVLAFVVLALAVYGTNAVDVAGDVREGIEKVLAKIKEPLVDLHDLKYSYNLLVEKIDIDINDVEVKGIKALDIKQLDYDESTSRLEYDLTFADVEVDIDLEIALSGLINLDHHPTAKIELLDLKLAGFAVVDVENTPNQITDFKVLVTLGGTEIELSNMLNDDELTETLNTVLNEQLPSIVDNIAVSLEPIVSPIVQSALNIYLRHADD